MSASSPRRRADDADLRERGDAAAHAVELAPVGIRAADRGEEDRVPLGAVARQVARVEHDGVAGAAAHEDGGDLQLLHAVFDAAERPAMRPKTAPDMSPVPSG